MKIIINDKICNQEELQSWQKKRMHKVLRTLRSSAKKDDTLESLHQKLITLKMQLSYQEILSTLKRKLIISTWLMKLASKVFPNKRRKAITIIYASGITANVFSKKIDALMLEDSKEYKRVNLSACPDHYVLQPNNGILEVIETTGNSPLPMQFFITFDDETGLKEPRNITYPHQSTGIAKLKDGTIIGGVRHQFRDTIDGMEARLVVEFPILCPKTIIKEHQKHLAVEWSNWIIWTINNQK